MSRLEKIYLQRVNKIKTLKRKGIDPYPVFASRDTEIGKILKNFSKFKGKTVCLVGRIISIRDHGRVTFVDLKDFTGTLQIFLSEDELGAEKYSFFREYLDIGDFFQVKGELFKTKAGEKTLKAKDLKILAKSLRPIPTQWYGVKDEELRMRKRYLEIMSDKKVLDKFVLRSQAISLIRKFLDKKGFLEVETPILQTLQGGALAKPFVTHLDVLDINLYLRIAPELYLKRLLVAGFEKIYELGKDFRNEGIDFAHNPEFTMMEIYWAYSNASELMAFIEKLIKFLIKELKLGSELFYRGRKIAILKDWGKITFTQVFQDFTGMNYAEVSKEKIRQWAEDKKLDVKRMTTKSKIADEIFKKLIRTKIIDPAFITDLPLEISPLAKRKKSSYPFADRFQLIIGGQELANGFSELNNPLEQKERFLFQEKLRQKGEEETQPFDKDFIEALEYGMPPAAGVGIGIDRLVSVLTNSSSIKEVILFPFVRRK